MLNTIVLFWISLVWLGIGTSSKTLFTEVKQKITLYSDYFQKGECKSPGLAVQDLQMVNNRSGSLCLTGIFLFYKSRNYNFGIVVIN